MTGDVRITSVRRVEGTVNGNVTCADDVDEGQVYVVSGGSVVGNIHAQRVMIEGEVRGDVTAGDAGDLLHIAESSGGEPT